MRITDSIAVYLQKPYFKDVFIPNGQVASCQNNAFKKIWICILVLYYFVSEITLNLSKMLYFESKNILKILINLTKHYQSIKGQ